jgi:phosphatidylglycerol:prolipoprotein diacylglycerol transferase
MILAVICGMQLAKVQKISVDDIIDLAFFVIVFGVLGARLYYVAFTWTEHSYLVTSGTFFENLWDTLYNIIAIWEGGLAIYGGVLAGLLTAFIFAKVKKIKFLKLFDILAPCCWIGQIIGRWGNFMNIEAYGSTTTLPLRMCSPKIAAELYFKKEIINFETYESILAGKVGVHPTFLYESLWNLAALIFVLCIFKKKKFDGQIFATYLIWYGFGRMLIEGLRTDSLMIGQFRVSQLIGLASCVLGISLMIFWAIRSKKSAEAIEENYTPVFETAVTDGEADVTVSEASSDNGTNYTTENKGE